MSNEFNSTTREGPHNTKTQVWLTPPWIIEALGGKDIFALDPCQWRHPEKGIIVETAQNYYFESDNGLSKEWVGRVFCNPPYSTKELPLWLDKMSQHNNGILLVFVRSETKAWQKYIKTATGINLIEKRISFLNSEGEAKNKKGQRSNGNAPSCLIAWGEDNYQLIKKIPGIYCRINKI